MVGSNDGLAITDPGACGGAAELRFAARRLEKAEGRGAFAFEGRMIDKPIVDRTDEILAMADAIARHEERAKALLQQTG